MPYRQPEARDVAWQLAVDAAGVGAFDWDLVTDELRWDDRLLKIFGVNPERFGGNIAAFNELVHPEDLPRVSAALATAIETCGRYEAEYRIVRPSGVVRWIAAKGIALAGEDGTAARLVGAAYDTTAARDEDTRVLRVLETMPSAFYHLDTHWRFAYLNPEAERLLDMTREEVLGKSLWELFPQARSGIFADHFKRAVATGETDTFEARLVSGRTYELNVWPTPDGLSVYFNDVTSRILAQAELDRASQRTKLVSDISSQLMNTLDPTEMVHGLAPMLVPTMGDWCVLTIVDNPQAYDWRRGLRDVGGWHRDPAKRDMVDRYIGGRLMALRDSSYLRQALDSSGPVVVSDRATDTMADVFRPGISLEILRELKPTCAVLVPMRGRDRTTGILTLFRDEPFTPEDLDLLVEVCTRAGLALDNARLFDAQHQAAETLQRAMLSPPATVPGVDLAVHYEPAADVAQVGGDWYDSFHVGDSVALVIGDLAGHDMLAAAAMGQLRSLLRGLALRAVSGPAELMAHADAAMTSLLPGTTATVLIATLTPTEEGHELRWANAGHPPPLLASPDGVVTVLNGSNDPLLGLGMAVERTEHQALLEPGSTLFLYTDGLVERRDRDFDSGIEALAAAFAEVAAAPSLDEMCDQLLSRMMPTHPDDDVAVLALRPHRPADPA